MPAKKQLDHNFDAGEEGIWKQHDLGGVAYLNEIFTRLGLHYDDACGCSNCNIICNVIEGENDARVRIVFEESLD
jgi:hypothetical protein